MNISLEFDARPTRFAGGDEVTGNVVVTSNESLNELEGVLRARWHIAAAGQEPKTGAPIELGLTPQQANGHICLPFAFQAPPGPYTHADEVVEVSWTVEAEVKDAGGQTASTSSELAIVSPESTRDDAPADTGGSGMSFMSFIAHFLDFSGISSTEADLRENLSRLPVGTGPYDRKHNPMRHVPIALVLLAVAVLIALQGASLFPNPEHAGVLWGTRAAGVLLAAFAGWRGYKVVRNFAAERRIGQVSMGVQPTYARLGDYLTCSVGFAPSAEVTVNRINATLKCVEHKKWRQRSRSSNSDGKRPMRTRRQKSVIEEVSVPFLDEPKTFGPGERVNFADMFAVPESSWHSNYFRAPFWVRALRFSTGRRRRHGRTLLFREVEWLLEVHIDIDNCPDWVKEYKLLVFPEPGEMQSQQRTLDTSF